VTDWTLHHSDEITMTGPRHSIFTSQELFLTPKRQSVKALKAIGC